MKQCTINGCANSHHSHGYCRRHVRKFRLYGDASIADKQSGTQGGKRICTIPGCQQYVHGNGLCSKHYSRLRIHGDVNYRDAEYRFHHSYTVVKDNCWEWQKSVDKDGYGKFTLNHQTGVRAHRYSWMLANGEIPPDMLICHTCDNPSCVNPSHLFLGTPLDNARDKVAKGRHVGNPNKDSQTGRFF